MALCPGWSLITVPGAGPHIALPGFLRSHQNCDLSSPHQPSVFLWSNTFLFMIKNIFIKANWVGLWSVAARGGVKVKPVQGDTPVNIIRQYCWDCYWVLWGLKMKEFHWCDVAMARAVISQERGHESDDNDLSWTEPRRRSCLRTEGVNMTKFLEHNIRRILPSPCWKRLLGFSHIRHSSTRV